MAASDNAFSMSVACWITLVTHCLSHSGTLWLYPCIIGALRVGMCLHISPRAFLVQSLAKVFLSHPQEEDSSRSGNIDNLSYPLSTVKVSTTNMDCLHQRWARQLLCGSTLVPHPSTLKLVSLPLVSGASLRLALGPHPPQTMKSCFTRREA